MRFATWVDQAAAWAWMVLRLVVVLALVVACYFVIPLRPGGISREAPWLVLFLVMMVLLVASAIVVIRRSRYAAPRALEAMVLTVLVYLVMFARFYASASSADPFGFSQPLDLTTSLYFTVTTFATVGFGDVHPVSTSMKLMVTVQMLMNLALLGGVVRLILTAGRRGTAGREMGRSASRDTGGDAESA